MFKDEDDPVSLSQLDMSSIVPDEEGEEQTAEKYTGIRNYSKEKIFEDTMGIDLAKLIG